MPCILLYLHVCVYPDWKENNDGEYDDDLTHDGGDVDDGDDGEEEIFAEDDGQGNESDTYHTHHTHL